MKIWRSTSASQIKTWLLCNRRWYWEKILGLRQPPSDAMLLGTEVHLRLERYLRDGTPVGADKAGQIAAAGLHLLPPPGSCSAEDVERRFSFHIGGLRCNGVIDLVKRTEILDHKTTSDFRYTKSEEELASDPQAIIYLEHAKGRIEEEPGGLRFTHVYYRTKAPYQARKVSVVQSDDDRRAGFARLGAITDEMTIAATLPEARLVSPNPNSCGAYGGCPHTARCSCIGDVDGLEDLSWLGQPQQQEETPTVSNILDLVMAQAATKPAPEPTSNPLLDVLGVAMAAPEPAPEPTSNPLLDVLGVAMSAPEPTKDFRIKLEPAPEPVETTGAAGGEINPPDGYPMDTPAPEPVEAKKGKDDPILPDGTRIKSLNKDATIERLAELRSALTAEQRAAYDAAGGNPSGTKRRDYQAALVRVCDALAGRSAAPEPAQVEAVAPEPAQVEAVAPEPAQVEAVAPEPAQVEELTMTLFVDCRPSVGEPSRLVDLLAPIMMKVAAAKGVPHYDMLDYGKGPRLVAAAVAAGLNTGTLTLPREIVALTVHPCTAFVLEVLEPRADLVIRGVK